jgi:hypothetical protein
MCLIWSSGRNYTSLLKLHGRAVSLNFSEHILSGYVTEKLCSLVHEDSASDRRKLGVVSLFAECLLYFWPPRIARERDKSIRGKEIKYKERIRITK